MRKENDFIGERELPDDALYGIHALRARENFPDRTTFLIEWYKAIGMVKKSCYLTYIDYKRAAREKYPEDVPKGSTHFLPATFPWIRDEVLHALIEAAEDVARGLHFSDFIVPAVSGGAGTSINMNVNEIIANVALKALGEEPGNYSLIDPIGDANIFQSTNDVVPTSLKVAVMFLLKDLENAINDLRFINEQKEVKHQSDLRIGYTQMQEAVPSSFGKFFSAYSEALSRDWWRVSKCFERIKVVNLGGSAIGTGIAVPRFFIMEAIHNLQKITNLPVTRSENLSDTTSNLDSFVEVHATLKAHAVNLEKLSSDIRLLASDLCNPTSTKVDQNSHKPGEPANPGQPEGGSHHQMVIPQRQLGSSIMPGKINPVIPEFVISAAHKIYANDQLITALCAQGCLELNAYLPVIGHALLESLELLIACNQTLKKNLFEELVIHPSISRNQLFRSPAITTALLPFVGYHKASILASQMKTKNQDIFEANRELKILKEEKLQSILKPENLLKLGYTLGDLLDAV
ncbi:MAG: lyase family protein [Bacteroidales bacterium]|jgi:aspartate ammonia-lyase|nr:lyase family protein [Bacteroidales bacterium]